MPRQYIIYITILAIVSLIASGMAYFSWRRQATGARILALLFVAIIIWSISYAMELGSFDLARRLFWSRMTFFGVASVPVIWFAFGLSFSNREAWLSRRNLILLAIIPILTIVFSWTDSFHGLMWREITLDKSGAVPVFDGERGLWFWVHAAYSYVLLLGGTLILVRMLMRAASLYRVQAYLVVLAILAPLILNGLYIFGTVPALKVDPTPFALSISTFALAWAFFGFHFLDIVPVARRMVIDVMDDGVIVLDAQNRIIDINKAAQKITSQEASTIIGRYSPEVLPAWAAWLAILAGPTEIEVEMTLDVSSESDHRIFDMRTTPLTNQQGEFRGHLLVLQDITRRKQAERALELARDQALEASRLKSELLSKVSHELRTPLGVISGYAELLEQDTFGALSEAQKEALTDIIENTHYLTHIVNELLDQAQFETGRVKLNILPLDLRSMLVQVESQMAVLAQEKGLDFQVKIASNVPQFIEGDQRRLQQILVNLISNAIKFTKSGRVDLAISCPDPAHWVVKVRDTGPGIPQEAQTYIFEPFRQVDGSYTREHEGTGLGLSIVKQLVTLMGGEINLNSEIGRGSIFTITLPLALEKEHIP